MQLNIEYEAKLAAYLKNQSSEKGSIVSDEVPRVVETVEDEQSAPVAESIVSDEVPMVFETVEDKQSAPVTESIVSEEVPMVVETVEDEQSASVAESVSVPQNNPKKRTKKVIQPSSISPRKTRSQRILEQKAK